MWFHLFLDPNRDPKTCPAPNSILISIIRRWEFYHWNVVFPMLMFVAVPFITLLYPVEELHSRSEVILGMLLTSVAFKFVINGYVPAISYLTLLDKYHITGTVFLIFMFGEAAIMYILYRNEIDMWLIQWLDRGVIGATAIIWFVLNYNFMYNQGSFFNLWTDCSDGESYTQEAAEKEFETRRFIERSLSESPQKYMHRGHTENLMRLRRASAGFEAGKPQEEVKGGGATSSAKIAPVEYYPVSTLAPCGAAGGTGRI